MRLVTFDPFRALGCPSASYIKPSLLMNHLDLIESADVVLFPDYADINLVCYAMGKKIFPSPASYMLGYDKIEMTRAFQSRFPNNVPRTMILPNDPRSVSRVRESFDLPFVAKLPRSSKGDGVFLVDSESDWHSYKRKTSMLYVQEKLEIDRDLRVIWVGDGLLYAYWRIAAPGAFHNNVAHGGRISMADIPQSALELVFHIASKFGIDYAGFDIAMLDGHPYVFEFNRLFGLEGLNRARIYPGKQIYDYLVKKFPGNQEQGPRDRPGANLDAIA